MDTFFLQKGQPYKRGDYSLQEGWPYKRGDYCLTKHNIHCLYLINSKTVTNDNIVKPKYPKTGKPK